MTDLDLTALLGEHPRRDAVVMKLARFMAPNEPTVANLVRLVNANAKGWSYRSGLTDPDRLFIVDALALQSREFVGRQGGRFNQRHHPIQQGGAGVVLSQSSVNDGHTVIVLLVSGIW